MSPPHSDQRLVTIKGQREERIIKVRFGKFELRGRGIGVLRVNFYDLETWNQKEKYMEKSFCCSVLQGLD